HAQRQIKQISGDGLPVAQRALFQRSPTFALTLAEGSTHLLLRITTTSQITAIPLLLEANTFARANTTEILVFGLYYGALLIVLVYNLVIGFSVRQRIYFLYCLLVLTTSLFWMAFDGYLGLYLFPQQPILANKALGVLIGLAIVVGNYFWTQALGVAARFRISRVLLMVVYLIALASILGVFYGPFPLLLPAMLLATVLSVVVLTYHALRNLRERHHIEQRIFGAAYLVYGMTILVTVLMNLSLLPATLWTAYSAQLGQFIHILALHLGLYFQVRASERQRDEARLSLARSQQEVEQERRVRRDQEELLRMIGHEVRTPIAQIDSARQILELLDTAQGINQDPARQRRYASVQRAVSRLSNLLDIALSLEQANPQEWQMTPRSIDSLLLTESVRSLLDPAIHARVSLYVDSAPSVVWADERMLRFALINLLDNAGKYSPADTPITIRLDPHAHEGAPGVRWRIENQGQIIPKEMQERIFDKYRRLDEAADTAGLGLGLYLVRYIFQRHGGWVRAESGRSSGAEFTSWLPVNTTEEKSP
ncbi:MAG: sensor histidine kinase, partial [Planctomycetes bacterium]|nr:sensor histidine kinase [Planctomycetota bacterium]